MWHGRIDRCVSCHYTKVASHVMTMFLKAVFTLPHHFVLHSAVLHI